MAYKVKAIKVSYQYVAIVYSGDIEVLRATARIEDMKTEDDLKKWFKYLIEGLKKHDKVCGVDDKVGIEYTEADLGIS